MTRFQTEREEEVEEEHIIYAVGAEEYRSCRVGSKKPRIIAYCTNPAKLRSDRTTRNKK